MLERHIILMFVSIKRRFIMCLCCSKENIIVFFAGAEAFHALSHLMIYFSGLLPLTFNLFGQTFILTPALNIAGIVINAAIAAGLLYWAHAICKCRAKKIEVEKVKYNDFNR